jgi:transcriptional regulator with XRE-family HTH domain
VDDRRRAKRAEAQPIKVALGKRIRTLRRRQGLSQEELADRVGVHTTYLSAIERGERNPALENLHAIAQALGVTLAKLFTFRDGAE